MVGPRPGSPNPARDEVPVRRRRWPGDVRPPARGRGGHRPLLGSFRLIRWGVFLAVLLLLLGGRQILLARPVARLDAALERGDRSLLAGAHDEALASYRSVAEAGDPRGWERVGRTEELRGRAEAALQAYGAAVEAGSSDARLLAQTARLALQQGRLPMAHDALRRLLRESPGELEARFLMAQWEIRRGRRDAAEAWLRRGLEINPRHNHFHYELALLQAERQDLAGAREHFVAAVGVNPEWDAQAQYQLGLVCLRLQDAPAALRALQAATDLDPRLAMPWYVLGALLREADPAASAAALRRFLELQPAGAEADEARRLLQGSGP